MTLPPPPKALNIWKILTIVLLAVVIIIGAIVGILATNHGTFNPATPTPTLTLTPTATPTLTATPTASKPTTMPTLTAPYVKVDYQTVGWFYNGWAVLDYNYTYLVLNVTITNHGYSQVNTDGSDGFSVVIDGNMYKALFLTPFNELTNASIIDKIYYAQKAEYDNYNFYSNPNLPSLPNPATLLDTGSINGLVFFQFGNPDVYPQQPQILNETFTLQYSVTYGSDATISGPNATVVINQK